MAEMTIDPTRLTRKDIIMILDVNPETFDNWCKDFEMPIIKTADMTKPLFHLGNVVRWRIDREKKDKKEKKKVSEPSSALAIEDKIKVQELRKKTRENDEADGILVNKKQMEDLFFRLGRGVRDNLMSKPQIYGPQLEGLSSFEITTYLRKEFEKLCNSLADLNHISDHDYALELHEMFMLGFNYGKVS